jgi:uncharacterized protein (TIGR03067 family)
MKTMLAAVVLLVAADKPKEADKDAKKLQGTWSFASLEIDGIAVENKYLRTNTFTFSGDKFRVKKGDKVIQAGTFKVGEGKKSATVDLAITEGEGKGMTWQGIYKVSGDTMKLAYFIGKGKRPTGFKGAAGIYLCELKKAKAKP